MNNSRLFQVPNLKLAVLDFLKQQCPEDRELFRLVCLHFSLFSEVADLWESEGRSRVRTLLAVMAQQGAAPVLLTNTEDMKQCLHMAMLSFTHAAEYFLRVRALYLYIGSRNICISHIRSLA
jgi:spatacsin